MSDIFVLRIEPTGEPRDRIRALAPPISIAPHALLVGGPISSALDLGTAGCRTGAFGLPSVTISGLKRLYLVRGQFHPFRLPAEAATKVGEPSPQAG